MGLLLGLNLCVAGYCDPTNELESRIRLKHTLIMPQLHASEDSKE